MVAFSLLGKALLQLRVQRTFEREGGLPDPSASPCATMLPKIMATSGAAAPPAPSAPLGPSTRVHWNPSLELSGGAHVPWAVPQPSKPILKVKEYGAVAQTGHWGDQAGDAAGADLLQPSDSTRRPLVQPRRLKIISKKRTRIVAFSQ